MPVCASICAGIIPANTTGVCGLSTRRGGINRIIFATCDIVFEDISDIAEWTPHVTACKIRASGAVLGQKPKGSFEKRRFTSCSPEQVSGGEKIITFQDYNSDNELFSDISFWNAILANPSRFQVGWLTCEGFFYGFYDFGIEIDEVIEDSRKGKSYKDGTLTIDQLELFQPILVPGLESLLVENQNRVCTP